MKNNCFRIACFYVPLGKFTVRWSMKNGYNGWRKIIISYHKMLLVLSMKSMVYNIDCLFCSVFWVYLPWKRINEMLLHISIGTFRVVVLNSEVKASSHGLYWSGDLELEHMWWNFGHKFWQNACFNNHIRVHYPPKTNWQMIWKRSYMLCYSTRLKTFLMCMF